METPEQFYEELRLYKRHVLFVAAGAALLVVAVVASVLDQDLRAKFWGICLVASGACEMVAGRIGTRCGRTVLTGWGVAAENGDAGAGFGESYTTRGLDDMTPNERIAFGKRAGIFLMVAGAFEMIMGFAVVTM